MRPPLSWLRFMRSRTKGTPAQFKQSSCTKRCKLTTSEPLFLRQFFNPNVAETHRAVVTLQQDRTRLIHLIVQLSARRLVALNVVVDFDSVQVRRDAVADDRHLGRLPFAAGFGYELIGRLEVIDRAIAALGQFAP